MRIGPAHVVADAVRRGKQRAVDVVAMSLARVQDLDPEVGAFVHVDPDAAFQAAAAVDALVRAGRDPGPLAGVPLAVKDLEDVAGMPTRAGSLLTDPAPARADSAHVARLRAAGAIPIGKTATPELGLALTTCSCLSGTTRNPWDLRRTPGGSSGGSAAAVAAGMVPLATGSDAGGSIRVPAAFCGLVGLRPTPGTVAAVSGAWSLSSPGVLATTAADAARYLEVASGAPTGSLRPHTAATKGLRASWSVDLGLAPVDETVADVAREAAATLAGVAGLATGPPFEITSLGLDEWAVLAAVDLWTRVAGLAWEARRDELTPSVRLALERTGELTVREIGDTARRAAEVRAQVEAAFCRTDVLMTPATAVVAFSATAPFLPVVAGRDASATGPAPFSVLANLCGCPAVSVPAGRDRHGLPIGLQFVGRPASDALLLRLAALLEGARPWPRTVPLGAGAARAWTSPNGTIRENIPERSGS